MSRSRISPVTEVTNTLVCILQGLIMPAPGNHNPRWSSITTAVRRTMRRGRLTGIDSDGSRLFCILSLAAIQAAGSSSRTDPEPGIRNVALAPPALLALSARLDTEK